MLLLGYLCVAGLFFLAVLMLFAAALVEEARRGRRTSTAALHVSTREGGPSAPTASLSLVEASDGAAAAAVPVSTSVGAQRAEVARLRATLEETRQAYLALADRTGTAAERRTLRAHLRGLRDQLRALGVDLRASRAA